MSETQIPAVETAQADREASGARPYGRYLEDFELGAVYKHWPAKTVTEADDHLFCLLTMNHHPLHINDVYAAESQQGRNVVVGPLVYSLALGMSVADVSGKAIANLATEELSHPAPVFHGDTLFAESEVLEVRPSQSKLDRGIVKVHTRVLNQDGTLVAQFKRAVLVPRTDAGLVAAELPDPDRRPAASETPDRARGAHPAERAAEDHRAVARRVHPAADRPAPAGPPAAVQGEDLAQRPEAGAGLDLRGVAEDVDTHEVAGERLGRTLQARGRPQGREAVLLPCLVDRGDHPQVARRRRRGRGDREQQAPRKGNA